MAFVSRCLMPARSIVPALVILLRWNNRAVADSPDAFISIAEEHNLIAPLTRYVIAEPFGSGTTSYQPSVSYRLINVAASHFRHGVLLKDLNQYRFSAEPSNWCWITERDQQA